MSITTSFIEHICWRHKVAFFLQDKLWVQYLEEQERKAAASNQENCDSVTIYCKTCDQKLCLGSDLRKKGTNYIADEKSLQDKVIIRMSENQRDFRTDTHIGKSFLLLLLLLFSIYIRAIYLRGFKGATKNSIVEQMSFK